MDALAQFVGIGTAALLAIAIAHKLSAVRSGQATHEPLIRVSARRVKRASELLIAATVLEAVILILFLVMPAAGFACAALLLAAYAVELRQLPQDEPCGCFGELLSSSPRLAILRNLALAAANVAALAAVVAGEVSGGLLTRDSVGILFLWTAVLAGSGLVRRLQIGSR